ncbi:hypothetical protein LJC74_01080 [Eubacteriales bacterium OttesenSCG-928-A19]|nr:hypothetical protein [Eubacteriales bacterium OttesenSCG-928-A19]
MKAIEILVRCRDAERDKERIQGKIQRYRDSAVSVTSFMDANGGGRSTGKHDKMGFFAGEIDQLTQDLQEREEEYGVEIQAACRLLDLVPEKDSEILHLYYVKRLTIQGIAGEKFVSYSYARKAKSDGMKQAMLIPEKVVNELLPAWYVERIQNKKAKIFD